MPTAHDSLLERITIDSDVRFGKACIRGHRITVQEILEWLSSGASQQQILADYPQLEPDDFLAVYAYAADLAAGRNASGGWSSSSTKVYRRGWFYYYAISFLSPKVRFETALLARAITDSGLETDFEGLLRHVPGAKVVILRSCDYPTDVAAKVLRRNAISIAERPNSQDHLIILDP
jgi:uncharacterized protein (DUF433 family)